MRTYNTLVLVVYDVGAVCGSVHSTNATGAVASSTAHSFSSNCYSRSSCVNATNVNIAIYYEALLIITAATVATM
jgi:hypothetical protein